MRKASDMLWHDDAFACALRQTTPMAVLVLDAQGRIEYANGHFEELTGWPLEEVRGKDWFETLIPKRDRDLARAQFEVSLRDTPPADPGSAIVTWSGEERLVEWHRHAIRDGEGAATRLLAVGLDITERRRAQEALEESENRLRNILDSMSFFVSVFLPDGTRVEVNRTPLAGARHSREEIIGKPLWEADWWSYSPALQERLRTIISCVARGETIREDIVA